MYTQKVNPKTHKKVGKPVFAGYMITFSTAMNTGDPRELHQLHG